MQAQEAIASVFVALAAAGLAGCAPVFDWREVRLAGTATAAMLPCKAASSARDVRLGAPSAPPVRLAMLSCRAGELTWALVSADVANPAGVSVALQAMGEGTTNNLRARVVKSEPAAVRGATPNAAAARVRLRGQRPDGAPAEALFVVFAHGTQVFQAVVIGATLNEPEAETFFASLRVAP